ncbi:hypothetical protein Tco_0897376, partial [Tanacetum coccineum]
MVAPTVSISVDSFEEKFRDMIDIGVDVTHPVPIASVVFPAATIEELRDLRDRVEIAEAERACWELCIPDLVP